MNFLTMKKGVYITLAPLAQLDMPALRCADILPEWVYEQALTMTPSRQQQFVAGRYLLADLLKQQFAIDVLPVTHSDNNGRPTFTQPDLPDFNISHSRHFIAVAVTRQGRIGLDIEQQRPRQHFSRVAKSCFSAAELAWLARQPEPLTAFWQLWTRREAALKLYAKGVWQMKQLQINPETWQLSAEFARDFYSGYQQLGDVHLSVCCDNVFDESDITFTQLT